MGKSNGFFKNNCKLNTSDFFDRISGMNGGYNRVYFPYGVCGGLVKISHIAVASHLYMTSQTRFCPYLFGG